MPQYFFPGFEEILPPIPVKPKKVIPPSDNREAMLHELVKDMSTVDIPYKDLDNTVLYDGDIYSPIMIIGEGPGETEVIQKKPFVGKSGKLLQEMLDCAGILRQNVYVTNAVVWRPPNNRTPLPEEIALMKPFLMKHISIINPKIIVLVGGIAYRCLMEKPIAISKIRGQWLKNEICEHIVNIFHPSYLLRSPSHRKETWEDIINLRKVIERTGNGNRLTPGCLFL